MSRFDDIATALAGADWENVSIGNKAIILAAIDALGVASRAEAALSLHDGGRLRATAERVLESAAAIDNDAAHVKLPRSAIGNLRAALHDAPVECNSGADAHFRKIEAAGMEAEAAVRDAWRPIETAPKDSTEILAAWDRSGVVAIVSHAREGVCGCFWLAEDDSYVSTPTHWQPLPNAPALIAEKDTAA